MAWVTPFTFTVNEVLTADSLNAMLRDNMNETAVAKATQANSYFTSTGVNALAERQFYREEAVSNIELTTTSAVFIGPRVSSVTHGGALLLMWNARLFNEGGFISSCGAVVEGSGDSFEVTKALRTASDETDIMRGFGFKWVTGLTPGTHDVGLYATVGGSTGHFAQREVIVMPF